MRNQFLQSSHRVRRAGLLIGALSTLLLSVGCISPAAGWVSSNVVPFDDQRSAILEVVPLGTPRDEAADLLKRAGITFSTSGGPEPGVYYCETWEMEPGERYHLFSELLFDSEGRLEGVRQTENNFSQSQ